MSVSISPLVFGVGNEGVSGVTIDRLKDCPGPEKTGLENDSDSSLRGLFLPRCSVSD